MIASWHAGGAMGRLDRTLRAPRPAPLLSVAIFVIYAIGGHTIISELFGAKHEDGYTVLLILSAGQVVQTYAGRAASR